MALAQKKRKREPLHLTEPKDVRQKTDSEVSLQEIKVQDKVEDKDELFNEPIQSALAKKI